MSKQFEILALSTSYPIRSGSVSGIFVQRLIGALRAYCSVAVLAPADDSPSPNSESGVICYKYAPRSMRVLAHKPGGIPAAIRRNKLNILLLPSFVAGYAISTFFNARYADVILANWAVSGVIGGVVGAILRKPRITVLRGEDVPSRIMGINSITLRAALHLSNRVIVVSSDMADFLHHYFPKYSHKICVIQNGVEAGFWALSRSARDKDLSKFCLLSVGSLIKRKNVEYILRELTRLASFGIPFSYKVIGDGPERPDLEKLALELGISERVEFCGVLIGDQLLDAYREANFLISASLHEGRPNVVMEAVAGGVIPLLSDIRGHREIASTLTGQILFDPRSEGSLCQLLVRINENPELRGGIFSLVQAKAEVLTSTWDVVAKKYMDVIRSVVDCSPKAGSF